MKDLQEIINSLSYRELDLLENMVNKRQREKLDNWEYDREMESEWWTGMFQGINEMLDNLSLNK